MEKGKVLILNRREMSALLMDSYCRADRWGSNDPFTGVQIRHPAYQIHYDSCQ